MLARAAGLEGLGLMKKLYALFVVLALIAAACGDDDSTGDTSTAEPADDTADEPADDAGSRLSVDPTILLPQGSPLR